MNVQSIPTGQLVQEFRDLMVAFAKDTTDAAMSRRLDAYQEEILRRMAW